MGSALSAIFPVAALGTGQAGKAIGGAVSGIGNLLGLGGNNDSGGAPPPAVPAYQSYMGDENSRLSSLPQLNTQPLNNLESFSTSGSNNPWVTAQMNALQQATGQAQGAAKANAASAGTQAADMAAARGGLSTGAAENLARNASNNETTAANNVVGQNLTQQGNIQSQNATNELGVMENLPGQEVQALQPALQEQSLWQQAANANTQGQNQFNMAGYQAQIAQQAGQEQAAAAGKSGKK